MRYEDASHTGAFQGSTPDARDDADAIPAGNRAPATGNVISGEGTQTGPSGSDYGPGAHITSIAGAGGEDSSFAGGKLGVSGEFGRLSIDAEGNYSYQAKANAPENSRDRFTYTLADNQGGSDTATLTIEIGKTPAVIKANAQQVVPGPDGVVVLPAGVELSDIHIVGRNLVIDLPDGSQMVIIDGAVFVPQLVLGGVEVPATNLAALLVGQEIAPAAGEGPPQSSGGNFEVPVAPLDPGVPLGDLIPPTEYGYIPPEPKEVFDVIDEEPEIFIQPDGQPAAVNATDTVDEKGLPVRNEGEPEGSGEEAAAGANGDPSEATAGTIIVDSPDGVDSLTITGADGIPREIVVGLVVDGAYGTLTITGNVGGNFTYSYVLDDNISHNDANPDHDDFSVTLTDNDGDKATATLVIDIIDDVPTARPDTDFVPAEQFGPVTGNVITDASAGDTGDSDNGRDTVGADDADLTAVTGFGSTTSISGGWTVQGQYGVLTIFTDGSYSYLRSQGTPGGVSDVFNYTLTDGDGDTSATTLTITIEDATPRLATPETALLDDDAKAGGNPGGTGDDPDGSNTSGNLAGAGGDGDLDYAFTGTNTLPAGFTIDPSSTASVLKIAQGGVVVLTITLDLETGAYTVVQNAPIDHPVIGATEDNLIFNIGVKVVDVDGDSAISSLTINVDDDTPLAFNDSDSITGGELSESGNVITGVGTNEGAANADKPGADGFDAITALSGPGGSDSNPAGGFTVAGVYGSLQMDASGNYTYTRTNGAPLSASEVFTYTYRDGDGDLASATLTITIADAGPQLATPATALLDDDALAGGNPGGTGDDPDNQNTSGNLAGSGGDGDLDYGFTGTNTLPAGFTIDPTSTASVLKIAQGGVVVLTVTLDLETGAYTVVQNAPIDHPVVGATEDNLPFSIGVFVTDADGDTATSSLSINVDDDTPIGNNDSDTVSNGTATGNVVTGVGTTEGAANADKPGADGFDTITSLSGSGGTDTNPSGGFTAAGTYGTLQMDANGNYTYTRADGSPGGVSESFTYIFKDGDGDLASAVLTINIPDAVPQLGTPSTALLDDDAFPGGNPGGTGDDPDGTNLSGSLAGSGGDGDLDYAFTGTNTLPAGFTVDPSSTASVLKIAQGGTVVLTITLDLETGAYTVVQNATIDHPTVSGTEDNLIFGIGVKVVDVDGDSATSTLTINVDDDTPLAFNDSDTVAAGTASGNVITGVGTNEGAANADKPGADGYDTITSLSGSGGTDTNPTGGFTAPGTYGTLQMDAAGNYTYTRAAGSPGGVSESFTYIYKDGDGDLASAVLTISIPDATPSLPAPPTVLLDDDAKTGGNPGGTGDDPDGSNTSGSLAGTGGDGDLDYAFTGTNTLPAGFSVDPSSTATVLKIAQAGVGVVLTITLDLETGAYTVVQNLPIDHPVVSGTEDNLIFGIGVKVIDVDGDSATSTLTINVDDDTPLAFNDSDTITSGGSTATGNVITGSGTNEGTANADKPGADGFDTVTALSSNANANSDTDATGGFTVVGQFGTLQMAADGTYTYTRASGGAGNVSESFTYTYKDGDGDLASAVLTINIQDAAPTLGTPATALLDDDAFTGGNPGGTGDDPDGTNLSGSLAGSGGDGDLDYAFTGTNTLPAGFTVDPTSTATTLKILQGSTVVLTVTLDLETGAYTVVQNATIDHPVVSGTEDNLVFGIGVKVIDVDGDSATNTLTINVDDDTPLANNDTDTVSAGTAVGNVITGVGTTEGSANADKPGADGFDTITSLSGSGGTDTNATGGFTAPGTYGTLQMAADGSYTYTRAAGTPGGVSESFTYIYKDGDGDLASATLTISIPDLTPTLPAPPTVLLDDDALTGGNPGGTGDDPDSQNVSGSLAGTGGDGDLDYAFTGTNTLPAGFSASVNGAGTILTISQTGVGVVLTVTLDLETGAYTVVQNQPIDHSIISTTEDNLSFGVGVKVIDVDGDSATNTLSINVDDDTPINFNPVDLTDTTGATSSPLDDALVNDGTAAATRFINDSNANPANGENFIGADGFGSLTFTATGHVNGEQLESAGGTPLTSGDDPIYVFGYGTGTLTATTSATNSDPAAVVFTVTLNPNGGNGSASTYTIDFNQTIDNGAGVTFNNLTSAKAGNVDVRGVGADDAATTVDLLLTASGPGGVNATINTDADSLGSGNQSMDEGETVRIDFVTNLQDDPTDNLVTFPSGFSYDGHVGTSSYLQTIPQVQGSQPETVAFRVYALDTTVTDAAAPDDVPTGPGDGWSDASIVTVTKVTVDGFDVGETPVTVNIGAVGVWTPIAYGVSAQLQADGSVIFTGVQQGDQYGIETGTDFNAVAVTSLPAGIGPVGGTSTTNSFDLGIFSIGSVDTGDPINLAFDVTATDGDGDTSTGTIDVTLVPDTSSALLAPLSTTSTSSTLMAANDDYSSLLAADTYQKYGGGNGNAFGNVGNTGIVAGMVAASGLASMYSTDFHSFSDPSLSSMVQSSFQPLSNQVVGREAAIEGDLLASTSLASQSGTAFQSTQLSGGSHGFNQAVDHSQILDGHMFGEFATAFRPAGTGDQAVNIGQAALAVTPAPAVMMASSEMLKALSLDGSAKHGGVVDKVLADALGHAGPPTVDHLLQAIGGGHGLGSLPAIADVASQSGGSVPAWDMGGHGAFVPAVEMVFKMDAAMLHHDAVQPVVNG